MPLTVLLLGGTGELGMAVRAELAAGGDHAVAASTTTEPPLDVTTDGAVDAALERLDPDVVVSLVGINDAGWCEAHPEMAWKVHTGGAAAMARWCRRHDRLGVYVSCDSVFDGTKGNYSELDEPNPLNVHAATKFLGERPILSAGGMVVRTRFLGPDPRSFVRRVCRALRKGSPVPGYTDQYLSPLHVDDLAEMLCWLLRRPSEGILNLGGRSAVRHSELVDFMAARIGSGAVVPGPTPNGTLRCPRDTSLCSDAAQAIMPFVDRGWMSAVVDSMPSFE